MTDDVKAAEVRAEAARAQLMATAQMLKDRISPATIGSNAVQSVKDHAADAATAGAEFAIENPRKLAGAAGALVMILIGRPLWRRFRSKRDATEHKPARSRSKPR